MVSRIKDARRDRLVKNQGWNTDSLTSISDDSFIGDWENDKKYSSYLNILKKNFNKKIEREWADYLQFVLSPFAVARIEKVLVEAMITGALDLTANSWNIAVIERDVPCAKMAIDDLSELYNHLCELKGILDRLPRINLTVISTEEFCHSPLHGDIEPRLSQEKDASYDVCIDISMLVRSKIDAKNISLKSETYYVARSSHYSQGVRTIYSADNIEYQPLVNKTSRGEYITIPEREKVLTYFLQNVFRKDHFREGQLPILSRALLNKTTIGLLPTGGGKSLSYQLAAMLQPGVTIVVDPLVSLMVDQYEGLVKQRIDVSACINSTQEREEKTFHLGRLQNGEIQFMFLSPERFMMEDFREELLKMTRRNHVYFSYGVIDEVHTVSEWGHDFRPAYLQLGRNMTRFMETSSGSDISIIGLTATASFDVLADVERELTVGGQMSLDSDAIVRPEMREREELTYRIVEVKADFSQFKLKNSSYVVSLNKWGLRDQVAKAKRIELDYLLSKIPYDIDELNNKKIIDNTFIIGYNPIIFYRQSTDGLYNNAGIVFCPIRAGLDGVNDRIGKYNVKTGISTYITSLSPDYIVGTFVGSNNSEDTEKNKELSKMNFQNMDAFINNEKNIMVATKAFGMGIDKPNVRFTININHPSSIESYVQEAGRAGRDKKVSISYLLYESTEYIELSVENIADALGVNNPYSWLNNYKDHYVLTTDFRGLCMQHNLTNTQMQQLEDSFSPFKQNVDKSIEMFFHTNSFRGSFKEKVILVELAYNILNVNNVPANNVAGVYGALNGLNDKDYSYVIVSWENQFQQNVQQYCNEIETEANNLAQQFGWNQLPANPFVSVDLYKINSFGELLQEISKITNDDNWRIYHNSSALWPLNKAFCKRRDKDDTDKAIYRMCCIGLVDDVTIDYNNHFYTLKIVKRPDGFYYNSLRVFFEKYYSINQSLHKVAEAKHHKGETESDKCLGYLADFVYENLEVKRRRAIEDMREACIDGIRNGDSWLKQFIHLYFNSKYARDKYEINGVSYSLKQDIKTNPSLALILKYIRVMDRDTSGTVMDNVKHLYGAVLIILRAQAKDDSANTILFLLRSYCLAFLGVGNNPTLIEEFKTGYSSEGFERIIETDNKRRPLSLLGLIDIYNDAVLRNTQDNAVKEYVADTKTVIKLQMTNKEIDNYTSLYTN